MKKLKILVIPSWYPNEKDPLWGNYFIKQASALNSYADVSMLYVNRIGLKEIRKLPKERLTDGYDDSTYNFKLFKKTIMNYKSLSVDYSFKRYSVAAYKAYKNFKLFIGKPDIIIAQSVLPAALAAKYISKKEGIPYIVHEHSENVMSNPLYIKYVKDIIKDADNYMAVNNSISNVIKSNGRDNCYIIPNFIECKKFDIKRTRKDKDFVLINICNFYKVKALDVLLKAMNLVVNKEKHSDIKLKIVGTGEYKDYYESIAHSLNLNSNVEFMGYIDNDKIPKIISNSNVLCVSSSFETFCIPIIEAFSAGIPVITTNCTGPLEIVDATNAIVVPIGNIDEFAKAILNMKENYNKYKSKSIKKYVCSKYDKSVVCKEIIDICNKTIDSK